MKVFAALTLASASLLTAAVHPQYAWTLAAGIDTPESVYFEPESQRLFVSNVAGSPGEKDGNGFVAEIVVANGKPELKRLVDGLNAPKGLRAQDGVLWATDIDELVAIDLKTNRLKEKFKVEGAQFLNDVGIAGDGTVFVSDTLGNKIYALRGGKVSVFAAGNHLESPNGLLVQGDRLIVAAWGLITDPSTFGAEAPGNVYSLDLKTKQKTVITKAPLGHLDGIEATAAGGLLVSDFASGKVYRLSRSGVATLIFEGAKNAADIGLAGKTLYVPDMGRNQVLAITL